MANGRGAGKTKRDTGRDAGGFVALPWAVLDSRAYGGLSHPAKALLMEVARQFHSDDNGRMLLSAKYLATRGWNSPDVIQRAKNELLRAELIFETVKGCRPNKASWYAVTWRKLDKLPGYDSGVERIFEQGAYKRGDSMADVSKMHGYDKANDKPLPRKNASLITFPVVEAPFIATSPVVEGPIATTSPVAMKAIPGPPPTTSPVHPLEMPSAGVRAGVAGVAVGHCVEGLPVERPTGKNGFGLLEQLRRRQANGSVLLGALPDADADSCALRAGLRKEQRH